MNSKGLSDIQRFRVDIHGLACHLSRWFFLSSEDFCFAPTTSKLLFARVLVRGTVE